MKKKNLFFPDGIRIFRIFNNENIIISMVVGIIEGRYKKKKTDENSYKNRVFFVPNNFKVNAYLNFRVIHYFGAILWEFFLLKSQDIITVDGNHSSPGNYILLRQHSVS